RALLQYFRPENRQKVLAALKAAGRQDLIGTGPNCLVPPDRSDRQKSTAPKQPPKKPTIRSRAKQKKK
ncbi:MAG: DUF3362 domain-containing protein, partial [Acutalibacteraceae bacterium]